MKLLFENWRRYLNEDWRDELESYLPDRLSRANLRRDIDTLKRRAKEEFTGVKLGGGKLSGPGSENPQRHVADWEAIDRNEDDPESVDAGLRKAFGGTEESAWEPDYGRPSWSESPVTRSDAELVNVRADPYFARAQWEAGKPFYNERVRAAVEKKWGPSPTGNPLDPYQKSREATSKLAGELFAYHEKKCSESGGTDYTSCFKVKQGWAKGAPDPADPGAKWDTDGDGIPDDVDKDDPSRDARIQAIPARYLRSKELEAKRKKARRPPSLYKQHNAEIARRRKEAQEELKKLGFEEFDELD